MVYIALCLWGLTCADSMCCVMCQSEHHVLIFICFKERHFYIVFIAPDIVKSLSWVLETSHPGTAFTRTPNQYFSHVHRQKISDFKAGSSYHIHVNKHAELCTWTCTSSRKPLMSLHHFSASVRIFKPNVFKYTVMSYQKISEVVITHAHSSNVRVKCLLPSVHRGSHYQKLQVVAHTEIIMQIT